MMAGMGDATADLLRDALPLAGVVVGAVIGAWLNGLGDAKRWRREMLRQFYEDHRAYLATAVVALDQEYVMLGLAAAAHRGERGPVPEERLVQAHVAWREAKSIGLVRAQPNVQLAMGRFDRARGRCMEAIKAGEPQEVVASQVELTAARQAVLEAADNSFKLLAPHLSRHMHPWRVRVWRRLRGEGVDYL